jgi:hypothetical protein
MPVGAHEHIINYNLEDFKNNKLNDNLFGLIQVEIETPDNLRHFETPEHLKTKAQVARLEQATPTSDSDKLPASHSRNLWPCPEPYHH